MCKLKKKKCKSILVTYSLLLLHGKIPTINRSTKWLNVESKTQAIYMSFKRCLNDAMSCDSLTFGGAFQSLLAKNVKKGSMRKLQIKRGQIQPWTKPTYIVRYIVKIKEKTSAADIGCPLVVQAFIQDN